VTDANDLWEKLGSLSDEESTHVLTRLFSSYEELHVKNPQNRETHQFFQLLENAVDFCRECNLNRR